MDGDHAYDVLLQRVESRRLPLEASWLGSLVCATDTGHGPDLSLVSFIVRRCAVGSVRRFPQLHARRGGWVPNCWILGMALVFGMACVLSFCIGSAH